VEREVREEVKESAWTSIFESRESTAPPTAAQLDEVQRLKHQLGLIGGLDEGIEQEYSQTNERYTFLKTQFDDLIKAAAQLEEGIAELDRTIKERFDDAFQKINEEFGKFFKSLFSGGSAKLVLLREEVQAEAAEEAEEEEADDDVKSRGRKVPVGTTSPIRGDHVALRDKDEVDEKAPNKGERVVTGIEIQATPPGKRLKGIAMLSGGERALTSIALICAIISNNPSPFVVLDEVDAALDEANSQRFAAILAHLAKQTQFVTITHNRATMEKANILYGVTMGDDGVSRMLSVKLEEAEGVIKKYGNR
jgi:chromosome segregation protein